MKFICVQPAIDYYTWQVEVMINNFIKNGVDPKDIQIISGYKVEVTDRWKKLESSYKDISFFFYKDDRFVPKYIPSIRPFLLYKHWKEHPELEKETVFYHDCDIILSKPVDLKELENDDVCYVSDTVSYIGAKYIRSKSEDYFNLMTKIVGVDKQLVIDNEKDSGGAQYILKGITSSFWKKVYIDCETLYSVIVKKQNGNPSEPFQIWCADMWAVLWNLWFFDKTVRVTDKMSFSWATSPMSSWEKHPIYHNAGVVKDGEGFFFKGMYQRNLPYNINLEDYSPNHCSYMYVQEILKTKEVSCLK